MSDKKIAIIGTGGVGGYIGAKLLHKASESRVITLIARGAHYLEISRRGLLLESPEFPKKFVRPHFIFNDLRDVGFNDIVLVCVKDYDLLTVLNGLGSLLNENSVIIPLMNGVDINDRIKTKLPHHRVLPTCVYVASHIISPGVIEHKGAPGIIYYGYDRAFRTDVSIEVQDVFQDAGINFIYSDDIEQRIRQKFLFIAGFGLISARYNKQIGEILADPGLSEQTITLMEEYARVLFDRLQIENEIKSAFDRAKKFPFDTKTSLQIDVHGNKAPDRNELELYLRPIASSPRQSESHVMKVVDEIKSMLHGKRKVAEG